MPIEGLEEYDHVAMLRAYSSRLHGHADIGGLKVCTANGWFAARPSGTENIYKVYAESFRGDAHLDQIIAEAQEIVTAALR